MMISLISGALVMGYLVAGLFFLRFWKDTGDRLFGIFGFAFLLLAAQRVALVLMVFEGEPATWLYGVRLAAFLLIFYAIYDKNRVPAR